MTFGDLLALASKGQLLPADNVREGESGAWKRAAEIASLRLPSAPAVRDTAQHVVATATPSRWLPAAVAAAFTAVVSVTVCWFLFSRGDSRLAIAPQPAAQS